MDLANALLSWRVTENIRPFAFVTLIIRLPLVLGDVAFRGTSWWLGHQFVFDTPRNMVGRLDIAERLFNSGSWPLGCLQLLILICDLWQYLIVFTFISALVFNLRLEAARARRARSRAPINGRALQRSYWATPLVLTAILTAVLVWVFGTIASGYTPERTFSAGLAYAGWWPWGLGAALGALGTFAGVRGASATRALMTGTLSAKPLPANHPIAQRVHHFADQLELPRPSVGVMNQINAFACGSRATDAVVVLGMPLIRALEPDELDAVIVHELAHVANGDMRRMEVAMGFQKNILGFFGSAYGRGVRELTRQNRRKPTDYNLLAMAMLLRMSGRIIGKTFFLITEFGVKKLSRDREYKADALAAALVSPQAMISALKKVRAASEANRETPAESEFSYMMMVRRRPEGWVRYYPIFGTHPPYHWRVAALEAGLHVASLPRKRD